MNNPNGSSSSALPRNVVKDLAALLGQFTQGRAPLALPHGEMNTAHGHGTPSTNNCQLMLCGQQHRGNNANVRRATTMSYDQSNADQSQSAVGAETQQPQLRDMPIDQANRGQGSMIAFDQRNRGQCSMLALEFQPRSRLALDAPPSDPTKAAIISGSTSVVEHDAGIPKNTAIVTTNTDNRISSEALGAAAFQALKQRNDKRKLAQQAERIAKKPAMATTSSTATKLAIGDIKLTSVQIKLVESLVVWDKNYKGKPKNNFASRCYAAAKKAGTQNGYPAEVCKKMATHAYTMGSEVWAKKG